MAYTDTNLEIYEDQHPLLSLVKIIAVTAAGYFVASFFALVLLKVWGIEPSQVMSAYNSPFDYPELKSFFMLSQAITAFILFILGPLFYLFILEKKPISSMSLPGSVDIVSLMLTVFIMMAAMVSMEFIVDWNQNVNLPDFLKDFEVWAKKEEETRKVITEFLTQFNSITEFAVGLVVIALLAAVGEELLFRGLIQNKVHALTKNIHLAIWSTAILFSLFHLQFYGLLPRILLGVLFGYLYYWSKNLLIPMVAHFINNALGVILIYLHYSKITESDLSEPENVPFSVTITAIVILSGLTFSFWKYYKGKPLLQ